MTNPVPRFGNEKTTPAGVHEDEQIGSFVTAKEAHAAFLSANAWRGPEHARQLLQQRIDSGALPKLPPEPTRTERVPEHLLGATPAPRADGSQADPDELAAAERSRRHNAGAWRGGRR